MLRVSKILIGSWDPHKVWLSPTGKIVEVPPTQEHADVARNSLLGEDFDPDFEKDALIEALQQGWIRIGTVMNQTYIMVWKLSRQSLDLSQRFIMTHPEFMKSKIGLEQYAVLGGRMGSYYGPTDEFLSMNTPQEVFQKVASVSPRSIINDGGAHESSKKESLSRISTCGGDSLHIPGGVHVSPGPHPNLRRSSNHRTAASADAPPVLIGGLDLQAQIRAWIVGKGFEIQRDTSGEIIYADPEQGSRWVVRHRGNGWYRESLVGKTGAAKITVKLILLT